MNAKVQILHFSAVASCRATVSQSAGMQTITNGFCNPSGKGTFFARPSRRRASLTNSQRIPENNTCKTEPFESLLPPRHVECENTRHAFVVSSAPRLDARHARGVKTESACVPSPRQKGSFSGVGARATISNLSAGTRTCSVSNFLRICCSASSTIWNGWQGKTFAPACGGSRSQTSFPKDRTSDRSSLPALVYSTVTRPAVQEGRIQWSRLSGVRVGPSFGAASKQAPRQSPRAEGTQNETTRERRRAPESFCRRASFPCAPRGGAGRDLVRPPGRWAKGIEEGRGRVARLRSKIHPRPRADHTDDDLADMAWRGVFDESHLAPKAERSIPRSCRGRTDFPVRRAWWKFRVKPRDRNSQKPMLSRHRCKVFLQRIPLPRRKVRRSSRLRLGLGFRLGLGLSLRRHRTEPRRLRSFEKEAPTRKRPQIPLLKKKTDSQSYKEEVS